MSITSDYLSSNRSCPDVTSARVFWSVRRTSLRLSLVHSRAKAVSGGKGREVIVGGLCVRNGRLHPLLLRGVALCDLDLGCEILPGSGAVFRRRLRLAAGAVELTFPGGFGLGALGKLGVGSLHGLGAIEFGVSLPEILVSLGEFRFAAPAEGAGELILVQ